MTFVHKVGATLTQVVKRYILHLVFLLPPNVKMQCFLKYLVRKLDKNLTVGRERLDVHKHMVFI